MAINHISAIIDIISTYQPIYTSTKKLFDIAIFARSVFVPCNRPVQTCTEQNYTSRSLHFNITLPSLHYWLESARSTKFEPRLTHTDTHARTRAENPRRTDVKRVRVTGCAALERGVVRKNKKKKTENDELARSGGNGRESQ